jgi:hypothetical protein
LTIIFSQILPVYEQFMYDLLFEMADLSHIGAFYRDYKTLLTAADCNTHRPICPNLSTGSNAIT